MSENLTARSVIEAVRQELSRALESLADHPAFEHRIDLRSLPLDPLQRDALRTTLGDGEVQAQVLGGGTTDIRETAFAGVWWVRHETPDGEPLFEQLVIARAPLELSAHPDDIRDAAGRLARRPDEENPHE